MNPSNRNMLIDEDEIRAALKPWRPDAQDFRARVRNRIEAASNKVQSASRRSTDNANHSRHSEWLRIAASFVPINLLGRNADTTIMPISFAAISLGKKLVVVLAFPFLCIFMVGLTLYGMLRIRAAQNGQPSGGFDIAQAKQVTLQWWKRYGWIASIVFVGTLAAPIAGWTTPLMISLVCSGFAAVSFVRALARERLVERSLIGGMCAAGLGLLGQASQSLSMVSGTSHQVLDPNLVTGVLFGGSLIISAFVRPLAWTKAGDMQALLKHTRDCLVIAIVVNVVALAGLAYVLASYIPLILSAIEVVLFVAALTSLRARIMSYLPRVAIRSIYLILLVAVCTQSYWRGVTALDIKKQVQLPELGQYRIWDQWADSAKWLSETGIGFDQQMVMQRVTEDLDRGTPPPAWILTAAVRSGVMSKTELLSYTNVQADCAQLADPQFSGQLLADLQSVYFRIVACNASGELTLAERDTLIHRLMVNWNDLDSNEYVSLGRMKNALLLTELFNVLDPKAHQEQRTADVHRWLVKHQITRPGLFQDGGGFRLYDQTYHCDRRATLSAISLMETYGVPAGLDLVQLRSYLRPNFVYDFQPYDYVPKTISRSKLNQIPDVPKLSALAYLQTESPLWLSILLVLLLFYATISSPVREEVQ